MHARKELQTYNDVLNSTTQIVSYKHMGFKIE